MYAIAIDGPSSSGKSSIAKRVAEKLNILHLNTGDLYRAVGLYAYQHGYASNLDDTGRLIGDEEEIKAITENAKIDIKFINKKQRTFLNGVDVTDSLRTPIISDYSSRVSVIPSIRDYISDIQREIAKNNNIVIEGRDITSHVLPDAKYKFYVTASAEVRAERRYKENIEKGIDCTFEEILEDMKQRDYRDMSRSYCPLIQVPDAIVIDTSNETLQENVERLLSYIKE